MKKNNVMRIACAVLILTLLSTSVISGTFAKYVTTGPEATDSARVAKWGVKIEATGNMFANGYEDAKYTSTTSASSASVWNEAEDKDLVAPGTEGSLAAISVTGKPEVDVAVTYEADLVLAGWEVDGAVYCPIEITVGTETFKVGDDGIADTAALETKVEEAIEAKAANYEHNTDLSVVNDDVQVSWVWDFEGNDDAKDTALGNAAADATAATIDLTVTATVTQID